MSGHCDDDDGGVGAGGSYLVSGQQTANRSSGSILHVDPVGQRVPPRPQLTLASGVTLFGQYVNGGGVAGRGGAYVGVVTGFLLHCWS
jgi:hypothetical protein